MIDDVMLEAEEKMEQALEASKRELASIRTGRANPSMFNPLLVDYYGAPTPLQQLAGITIPEARTAIVSPYDRSAMKAITTAIRESDLGVNPTDDGTIIRVTLPALTEERRKQLVRQASEKLEEARIALRNIRQDGIKDAKKMKEAKELSEDDLKMIEKEFDRLMNEFQDKLESTFKDKEKDILTI